MQIVGIIGGGITVAVIASELSQHPDQFQVLVFDQGQRGPGGRASHRSVDPLTQQVLPNDNDPDRIAAGTAYEFDHGCQFFRADRPDMQRLVQEWIQKGWVTPWTAKWCRLGTAPNFFGMPTGGSQSTLYVGVGGMHQVVRRLMASTAAKQSVTVHGGTRVSQATEPQSRLRGSSLIWLGLGAIFAATISTRQETAFVTHRELCSRSTLSLLCSHTHRFLVPTMGSSRLHQS